MSCHVCSCISDKRLKFLVSKERWPRHLLQPQPTVRISLWGSRSVGGPGSSLVLVIQMGWTRSCSSSLPLSHHLPSTFPSRDKEGLPQKSCCCQQDYCFTTEDTDGVELLSKNVVSLDFPLKSSVNGEERDTSGAWVGEGGTRINFLFVLMVTPYYLQTQRCYLREMNPWTLNIMVRFTFLFQWLTLIPRTCHSATSV